MLVIVGITITFVAVNCGGLSSPMNGSISGNLTVYPNIVKFSCDPGYILRGSSVRKCQSNGTWDGYGTVCQGEYSPQRPPWGQTKVASVKRLPLWGGLPRLIIHRPYGSNIMTILGFSSVAEKTGCC